MRKPLAPSELRQLKLVLYGGPLLMLVILFLVLTSVFDLNPVMAGVIAMGAAAFEFVILSIFVRRHQGKDTDRIG